MTKLAAETAITIDTGSTLQHTTVGDYLATVTLTEAQLADFDDLVGEGSVFQTSGDHGVVWIFQPIFRTPEQVAQTAREAAAWAADNTLDQMFSG